MCLWPPSVTFRRKCHWNHFAARLPHRYFVLNEDTSRSLAEPQQLSCSVSLFATPSPFAVAGDLEVSSRLQGIAAASSWSPGRRRDTTQHTRWVIRSRFSVRLMAVFTGRDWQAQWLWPKCWESPAAWSANMNGDDLNRTSKWTTEGKQWLASRASDVETGEGWRLTAQ